MAGESKARLGERFRISAKSVQRLLRKHGVRRTDPRDRLSQK
jgi:hypothetical protein